MKPRGIELGWIVVKDINAAIKFYTDVVGLKLHEHNKDFGWAELSGPEGSRLGIAQYSAEHSDMKAGSNAVLTLTVDDIQKAREDLLKQKANLIGDVMEIPGEVKMQTFKDADGNTFQLCELLR